jgi:hypothetical protein
MAGVVTRGNAGESQNVARTFSWWANVYRSIPVSGSGS